MDHEDETMQRKVQDVEASLECARLSQVALEAIVRLVAEARAMEVPMTTATPAAPAAPRSWSPEVAATGAGPWTPFGLRFHTEAAASAWARDFCARFWALVHAYRAAPSDDEPNQNDEVLAADRESWRI